MREVMLSLEEFYSLGSLIPSTETVQVNIGMYEMMFINTVQNSNIQENVRSRDNLTAYLVHGVTEGPYRLAHQHLWLTTIEPPDQS